MRAKSLSRLNKSLKRGQLGLVIKYDQPRKFGELMLVIFSDNRKDVYGQLQKMHRASRTLAITTDWLFLRKRSPMRIKFHLLIGIFVIMKYFSITVAIMRKQILNICCYSSLQKLSFVGDSVQAMIQRVSRFLYVNSKTIDFMKNTKLKCAKFFGSEVNSI